MSSTSSTIDIKEILSIADEAGQAIMDVYATDFSHVAKGDESPLTEADTRSHAIISRRLAEAYPDIPILSEEGADIPWETRKTWTRFWLVDPLDGTKEFLKRNGEFTVNIALVEDGNPILGVVTLPAKALAYFAGSGGAFRRNPDGGVDAIHVSMPRDGRQIAVRSRSHSAPEEEEFLKARGATETVAAGSSLKFCMIADGRAHVYYRHGPTWEWDTAAGQSIVSAAGGSVSDRSGMPIRYNKSEHKNDSFVASFRSLNKTWKIDER